MLKKFSSFFVLFLLSFVSLANVWSSNYPVLNESSETIFSNEISVQKFAVYPLHTIEDSKEIVVAEKEWEEEQKEKRNLLIPDKFDFNSTLIEKVSCSKVDSPDSYFSNHLYDLFCSWKSFILV
jgi:hypothetical protein